MDGGHLPRPSRREGAIDPDEFFRANHAISVERHPPTVRRPTRLPAHSSSPEAISHALTMPVATSKTRAERYTASISRDPRSGRRRRSDWATASRSSPAASPGALTTRTVTSTYGSTSASSRASRTARCSPSPRVSARRTKPYAPGCSTPGRSSDPGPRPRPAGCAYREGVRRGRPIRSARGRREQDASSVAPPSGRLPIRPEVELLGLDGKGCVAMAVAWFGLRAGRSKQPARWSAR